MSAFIRFHLPPILLAVIISFLSSLPPSEIPVLLFPGSDKVVHSILYLALAGLLHRSLARHSTSGWVGRNALVLSVVFTVCYGWIDEWHQSTVPGRDSSTGDFTADAFGAILYAGGYMLMKKLQDPGHLR